MMGALNLMLLLFLLKLEITEAFTLQPKSTVCARNLHNKASNCLQENNRQGFILNNFPRSYSSGEDGEAPNDAFLNSLENMDDPSPDSLAALRDSATSNVANFLSNFGPPANEKEGIDTNTAVATNDTLISDQQEGEGVSPELEKEDLVQWDVYVCQSKPCKERGASATLDSFQALAPPDIVNVHPAILSKTKSKGPNIRCIQRTAPDKAFEVNNINDLSKVYRILTKHMGISNVSTTARDCLMYTYEGNAHLEKNDLTAAISSYNAALATNYEPQEGMLLLLRATAYLKRAFEHQAILRETVDKLGETVSDPAALGKLYQIAEQNPTLAKALFSKILLDTKAQDKDFRQTKYRHGLYEYALLHAAQDSLRSTQLLPHHAKTWLRAGDALAELRKLKESAMYYEKAMELDPTLRDRLEPVIERLKRSQDFLDRARGWWSSDTLRLALDVAA